ncbi:uncharacterized protein [Lolium perenne]|uniref:uncharacterized protein n=1 Tax=Lolium perenne TaxID=4522 RepID=UPI003A9A528D
MISLADVGCQTLGCDAGDTSHLGENPSAGAGFWCPRPSPPPCSSRRWPRNPAGAWQHSERLQLLLSDVVHSQQSMNCPQLPRQGRLPPCLQHHTDTQRDVLVPALDGSDLIASSKTGAGEGSLGWPINLWIKRNFRGYRISKQLGEWSKA